MSAKYTERKSQTQVPRHLAGEPAFLPIRQRFNDHIVHLFGEVKRFLQSAFPYEQMTFPILS